jgi:hypothetical protein
MWRNIAEIYAYFIGMVDSFEVMVSVLASSVVDRRFEPRSGDTEDYKLDLYLLLFR